MNRFKKLICVLFVTIMLLAVAGCVQSEDTTVGEKHAANPVGQEVQTVEEGSVGLAFQKGATMSLVNEAVELMNEKGELAFDEFREKDSKWFHNDIYLSIWTTEGIRVAYAPNVSSEGENVSDLKDYNGNPLGQLFIDTALSEDGEGWVDYRWPKPGETSPTLKYTFVKRASIGDQTYLVTSGFYVDDYVYTNNLQDIEYFTRFGTVSLGNLLHPGIVDGDLGVDYSIAHVIIKPGGSIESHMMKNPEVHYVLAGEGVLYIEDVPFELGEGQLILIPASSKQHTENTGNTDLEFFAIDQPAWAQENEELVE
ncbi:cache domain-containing protein [Methanolobus mangrovi]|uniref:Cache domain-containing protein n=1 Tax=Methanolobus mangrovi TaxID=3072977 RepID=A0AA51UI29_9EURY|nr:cache domain-containing protein [Methanolobus mangrovi]WMW23393.1 cache domain-containing protein [Methanolobus mangrovi]